MDEHPAHGPGVSEPHAKIGGPGQTGHSIHLGRPSLVETLGVSLVALDEVRLAQAAVDYAGRYIRPSSSLVLLDETGSSEHPVVRAVSDQSLNPLVSQKLSGISDLIDSLRQAVDPISIPDVTAFSGEKPRSTLMSELAEKGYRAMVIAPVGQLGAIVMCSSESFAFSKYDEVSLASLAAQLAFLIDASRELLHARKSAAISQEIMEMGTRLTQNLDSGSVLNELLREVATLLGAHAGSLMLLDKGSGRLYVRAGFGIDEEGMVASIEVGEGIAGWVAKTGKPIVISDAAGLGPELPDTELRSTLSLPIKSGDSVIGVVNVGKKGAGQRFEPDTVAPAAALLAKAAIALENAQASAAMRDLYIETVQALTQVIETKDPYSRGHSEHVTTYAMAAAQALGMVGDDLETLRIAAMLHDIGYAGITDSIFRGQRPLTAVERVLVNTHPVVASEVLKQVPLLSGIVPLILHHHENFDGSGYVSGLKGDEIPLGSRILAVADAFDAMTCERAYRQAMPADQAVGELRRNAGRQFDPDVVYAFCNLVEEGKIGRVERG